MICKCLTAKASRHHARLAFQPGQAEEESEEVDEQLSIHTLRQLYQLYLEHSAPTAPRCQQTYAGEALTNFERTLLA